MRSGNFIFHPGTARERVVGNTLVGDGAEAILRVVFSGEALLPVNYYLGLTNAPYTYLEADLTDIAAGEPVGNGYERQAIPRDVASWSYDIVNGIWRARSLTVQFEASGTWSVEYTRAFLCTVETGDDGFVMALSGALSPQVILSGEGPPLAWEHWARP